MCLGSRPGSQVAAVDPPLRQEDKRPERDGERRNPHPGGAGHQGQLPRVRPRVLLHAAAVRLSRTAQFQTDTAGRFGRSCPGKLRCNTVVSFATMDKFESRFF